MHSEHSLYLAWFQFIEEFHEKHLNFCECKEYEKRKLKCVSTFKMTRTFPCLNVLVRVDYKVKNFYNLFVIFCFYIVARIAWNCKKLEEKGIRV